MVKKLSQLYLDTRRTLMQSEDAQSAGFLARNLLCFITGKDQAQILQDSEMYVGDETCAAMEAAVARIQAGEPLAYILNEWEFYGADPQG